MAVGKTTEILEFKVEQDGAIADLERTKKSIINLKKEQAELNKAYKAGDITLEEYSAELVRVESILKKQTSSYSTLQKSVAGVETQMDKLIKSNNKLSDATNNAVSNIRVAGVSVGDLTTKIAAFANPVTASVGLLGALGTAYAKSTIGAKDLEFAQNQLNYALTIGSNAFASMISSAEDGEGFFSRITDGLITQFLGMDVAFQSRLVAASSEMLEDLGRTELEIRDKVNERLEENQEKLTEISSEQTKYEDKVFKTGQIIDNIRKNESELVAIKKDQLAQLQIQLAVDSENESLQTAVLEKQREISNIERDAEKRVQATLRLKDNLLDSETKRLEVLKKQAQTEGARTAEEDARLSLQLLESSRKQAHEEFLIEKKKNEDLKKEREKDLLHKQDILDRTRKGIYQKVEKLDKEQIKRQQDLRDSEANTLRFREQIFSETSRLLGDLGANQKAFILAQLAFDTASAIGSLVKNSEKPESEAERAARYLAGFARISANIGQAYRLIGSSAPVIGAGSVGTIITSSTGQQFVIQNGQAVSLEEAQRKEANKARRAEDLGTIATGASIGAAIGGIPGAIAGALIGGIAVGFKRLFGRGKAEGGYAGDGEKYEPKGFYHGGEVIWSKADVAAVGGPMIADSMRPTFKSSSGLKASSFVGGHQGGTIRDLINAINNRPLEVSVKEISSMQGRVSVKERFTRK